MKKTDINGEKGVQITNVSTKIEVTFWAKIMTMEFRGLYMAFIFLLRDWYDQKLELLLLAVLTSLKIKFEHTQISVRKIDITMSKTAWTKPLSLVDSSNRTVKWSHAMIFSYFFFWRIRSLIIFFNWKTVFHLLCKSFPKIEWQKKTEI